MNNFSERIKKVFSVNKIVCNTKDEVREAIDKIIQSNDWSTEVVCNFDNAKGLFYLMEYKDLSKLKLNTSKVTNMDGMFQGCESLTSIPQLDTSKVIDMRHMFFNCKFLTSISQLDTSKVTNMDGMFAGCKFLTSIPQLDTSKVTNMCYMFAECESLRSIPQLDTSKVTNMNGMFRICLSLTIIPKLNMSKITDKYQMRDMFEYCSELVSLGYPTSSANKMKEIISTTGIDGKPYKS